MKRMAVITICLSVLIAGVASGDNRDSLPINISLLINGGIPLVGGEIAVPTGITATQSVQFGFDVGIGASYMFLNNLVGPAVNIKYSNRAFGLAYSGTYENISINDSIKYQTNFIDIGIGAKGYFLNLLVYELGFTYSILLGEVAFSGLDLESWPQDHTFNNDMRLYAGAGVYFPIIEKLAIELEARGEWGIPVIIEGSSPLGVAGGNDSLKGSMVSILVSVTYSF